MVSKSRHSAVAVAKQVNRLLQAGLLKSEPVWYQPVLHTPPMTDVARKPAQSHRARNRNRPNDIREIQGISQGLELYLRRKFYKEHPWELARPRIVVEEDGADYVRQDWSKMEQIGKPLDGESVVRRALYLMREHKTPVKRYQEIHGFDESQARGRPLSSIPRYGNIQEVNEEADRIIKAWKQLASELDELILHRQRLSTTLQSLESQDSTSTEIDSSNSPSLRDEIRSRLNLIKIQIHRLQKKLRKMCNISIQEAYLTACSEFYLLRQQEETDIRIAIEQARNFRREMGTTVNERELIKEQDAFREWRARADRYHLMSYDARVKAKEAEGVSPETQSEQTEQVDEEEVEEGTERS